MNIIISFEDPFAVSVVLLQSAFETTSSLTGALCSWDFLAAICLTAESTTIKRDVCVAVVRFSSRWWTAIIFPSFDTTAVDFNWQFVQSGSAKRDAENHGHENDGLRMKDQTLAKSRTWKCSTWKWQTKWYDMKMKDLQMQNLIIAYRTWKRRTWKWSRVVVPLFCLTLYSVNQRNPGH